MNQAEITKLVSKLRFKIQPQRRQMPSMRGPMGRIDRLRESVTALIKYERIELYYPRADESRGYAERVFISFFNNKIYGYRFIAHNLNLFSNKNS